MQEIIQLPIEKIGPNPYQPRKIFDNASLQDLAASIKEHGIMQPINVRIINGSSYELVSGERRLRASKLAGLQLVPCTILNISDQDSAVLAMIENLQRQDLTFLEEAEGYLNLLHDHGLTQELLSERVGKSQSSIANKLRLLKLPDEVKKLILEKGLTERHARAFLKISDEAQLLSIAETVVRDELSVKDTEALIDEIINPKKGKLKKTKRKFKLFIKDIRLFTNTVKSAVDIMVKSGIKTDYVCNEVDDGLEIRIHIKNKEQAKA